MSLLPDLSGQTAGRIAETVGAVKRPGDIVVASIHCGSIRGYQIPCGQRDFAHKLIAATQVDIVHGPSSHNAKGIEVYKDKPILYGCGDFLDDYEGISGYEAFRDDLALMNFASMETTSGRLVRLEMRPLQIRNFRLKRTSRQDVEWLRDVLERGGARRGTR